MLKTLRLSLVRFVGEEEAPRLRLGSRSSAPRPVAMSGLLADPMTSANDSTENAARYSDSSSRDSIDNSDESISRRAFIAWYARGRSISSASTLTRDDKRESYVVRPIGDQMLFVECRRIYFAVSSSKEFADEDADKRKRRSCERRSHPLKKVERIRPSP
jgi:hypothetical protein